MKATDLWNRLMVGLDDDQMIVFPEIYLNNRDLYDKICGIAYLITTDSGLDWVWEKGLERALNNGATLEDKVYIVRVRLPWNEPEGEWWVSREELDANYEELEVLEVRIRAVPKDKPHKIKRLEPLEFELNRDHWTVIDAQYLVYWRTEPDEIKGDNHEV